MDEAASSGNRVQVEMGALAPGGRRFQLRGAALEEQVLAPLQAIEAAQGVGWTGLAREQYLRLHEQLMRSLQHVSAQAQGLGRTLEQSAGAYGVVSQIRFGPEAGTGGLPIETERIAGAGVPGGRVVAQRNVDTRRTVGSMHPWTGSGAPPQWDNPDSTKAYDHIASTHGPKLKWPDWFRARAASTGDDQGQWLDARYWVAAERIALPHPGQYIIEFDAPIGRVYRPDGTIVDNVRRAVVVRKPDGTLRAAYPVTDSYTL